jgi:WD40 repeat protein
MTISTPQVFCFRVIWSPDGTRLLTTGIEDGTARIWDAENGRELHAMTGLVQGRGSDWSPVENLAAIGSHDSLVHLWDVVSGQEVNKFFGTIEAPYHLAFSPGGDRLLTLGASHNVNVYDLSEAHIKIPMKTYGGISIPAWSPDGKQLAFGTGFSANYALKIWEVSSGEVLVDLSDQVGAPGSIAWSPSGDRFLTPDEEDKTIRIWDTATWELLHSFTNPGILSGHWLYSDWSPDGSKIAVNSYDPTVVIWDAFTGEEIITFSGHQDRVLGIAWSPDGTRILSNGSQGEAMVWEAATGQLLHNLFPEDYNLAVAHGAWTKDSGRIVVLGEDGFVTIFDSRTGEQQSQFSTTTTTSFAIPFSLSPSDERIIIGSHDGVARVWNLASGTQLLGYEVGGFNTPVYSPDGRWVAIGTTEGTEGKLQIFPTWHSTEELIAYAREHCVFRELTVEERELFGLPEREEEDTPP